MNRNDAIAIAARAGFSVGSDKTQASAVKLFNEVIEFAAGVADKRGSVPVYKDFEVARLVHARKHEAQLIAGTIREQKVK